MLYAHTASNGASMMTSCLDRNGGRRGAPHIAVFDVWELCCSTLIKNLTDFLGAGLISQDAAGAEKLLLPF
jgi:hypothetical protein